MKSRLVLSALFIAFVSITCHQTRDLVPARTRHMQPSEVLSYHPPIVMNIGWVPYQEQKLVKTKKDEWAIVDGKGKEGAVPVLLLTYPDTEDTVWLDMNMDNALLGKLLKHTLMTQEPISRPYTEYFEVASCGRCHPADVKVNFD